MGTWNTPFDLIALSGSPWQWILLFVSAVLIGMSKTGMQGINTITIPLLAITFGAKQSTGVILPMLCVADVIAVLYYRSHAEWKHIWRLLPYAIIGFFVAIAVDKFVPAQQFKYLMAACIGGSLLFLIGKKERSSLLRISDKWWFAPLFGLMGGFSTMIGNAAGPVMAVFLLALQLPKFAYVGTAAWFFLLVNYLKLPLQIFVWDNITWNTILLNIYTIPFILIGTIIGIKLVKKMPESHYRRFIIALTLLSTLMLLI